MSGLFGGDTPTPPTPKPPAPMPDENSPQVIEANRREQLAIANRAGSRRSTILSQPFKSGPSANFDTYDRKSLGASQ